MEMQINSRGGARVILADGTQLALEERDGGLVVRGYDGALVISPHAANEVTITVRPSEQFKVRRPES